jgi:hypothetical protein
MKVTMRDKLELAARRVGYSVTYSARVRSATVRDKNGKLLLTEHTGKATLAWLEEKREAREGKS